MSPQANLANFRLNSKIKRSAHARLCFYCRYDVFCCNFQFTVDSVKFFCMFRCICKVLLISILSLVNHKGLQGMQYPEFPPPPSIRYILFIIHSNTIPLSSQGTGKHMFDCVLTFTSNILKLQVKRESRRKTEKLECLFTFHIYEHPL